MVKRRTMFLFLKISPSVLCPLQMHGVFFLLFCPKSDSASKVEICRDRHDRRSCKICASCVNFPGNQRNVSHKLSRTTRFTHTKCDFELKLLKFYTLSRILA